eukprot:TRINITY_DN5467_c0_g2_i1.p1 TRINITY_DN5467_c0_g2~~TRINITY_DN5467_c0_g2_i1.p1  ORF type:complete len:1039 (-),score=295.30 TRINITY_DN5467_c0_g2_i1:47-3163(-)
MAVVQEPFVFPDDEPPGLEEPLVRLKTAGMSNFFAWVYGAIAELDKGAEAASAWQAATDSQLQERFALIEDKVFDGNSPFAGRVWTPAGAEAAGGEFGGAPGAGGAADDSPGGGAAAAGGGTGGGGGGAPRSGGLESRTAFVEQRLDHLAEDVNGLKEAQRESLISGVLEKATDDQIATVVKAVNDAGRDGRVALEQVAALAADLADLRQHLGAPPSTPLPSPSAAAAGGARQDGAGIRFAPSALEVPVGDAPMPEGVGLPEVWRELQALRRAIATGEPLMPSASAGMMVPGTPSRSAAATASALAAIEQLQGEVKQISREVQSLRAVSARSASPSGSPTRTFADKNLGASPRYGPGSGPLDVEFQGDVPDMVAASPVASEVFDHGAAHSPVAASDQAAPSHAADGAPAATPASVASDDAAAAGGTDSAAAAPTSGTGDTDGHTERAPSPPPNAAASGSGNAGRGGAAGGGPVQAASPAGSYNGARMDSRRSARMDGAQPLHPWHEGDEFADERLVDMEERLADVQGELDALKAAIANENEERLAAVERRVDELCGGEVVAGGSPTAGAVAARRTSASPGGSPTAASAAPPVDVASVARAAAAKAAESGDPVGAALAAVEAVGSAIGARTAEIEGRLETLESIQGLPPHVPASGGAAPGGQQPQQQQQQGGKSGKKQKQKQSAGGAAPGGAGSSAAPGDPSSAVDAVRAVQGRVDELARQFDDSVDEEEGDDASQGARIAMLEGRLSALAESVDGIIRRQREDLVAGLGEAPDGMAVLASSTGGSEADGGAAPRPPAAPLSLAGLDRQVKKLTGDLDKLTKQVGGQRGKDRTPTSGGAASGGGGGGVSNEELVEELDKRFETRLTAVWTELTQHARAAAVRADALEKALVERLDKHDASIAFLLKDAEDRAKERELIQKMARQIDWLNWRISWLEWATGGEKRGFARPQDVKTLTTQTAAATAFGQPLTEDVELWAREPVGGRQRLRREPLNVRGSVRTGPTGTGLMRDPRATGEAGSDEPLMMHGSRSTGKLPSLVG